MNINKCVIIYGLPATGKSTIAEACCEVLKRYNIDSFYLSGDKIANIAYYCKYSEEELDIKYKVIKEIFKVLKEGNRIIIFDDIFKRTQDVEDVQSKLMELNFDIYPVRLFSSVEESILRDSLRPPDISLGTIKMKEYYRRFGSIEIENSLVLSTINYSISNCVSSILDFCGISVMWGY